MEINDQVHEAMAGSQPEPERALEFLKKLEEFAIKIDKATFIKTKNEKAATESKDDKDLDFLTGNISPGDKRRNRFSKASDQLMLGHMISDDFYDLGPGNNNLVHTLFMKVSDIHKED